MKLVTMAGEPGLPAGARRLVPDDVAALLIASGKARDPEDWPARVNAAMGPEPEPRGKRKGYLTK